MATLLGIYFTNLFDFGPSLANQRATLTSGHYELEYDWPVARLGQGRRVASIATAATAAAILAVRVGRGQVQVVQQIVRLLHPMKMGRVDKCSV